MKHFLLVAFFIQYSLIAIASPELTTIAEKSGWKQTGRADEVERLCHDFQKTYPSRVKCTALGKTPEGRTVWIVTVGKPSDPVVWVQAGIHAGEIDGKDATFWLLKDILAKKISPDPLEGICLVFLPIMNVDGHERFGRHSRPNQVGPEESGWRVTSQNYNLNRDYVKVDAPEMRLITKYWRKMNPVLSLDLHVTNGAQFQPEVGIVVLPNLSLGQSEFHRAGSLVETEVVRKLSERGHAALPFYPDLIEQDNPLSGFYRYVATPRFSHGYWYTMDRIGMLVESHSWKDYATRVKTHYNLVLASLEVAQKNARQWQSLKKSTVAGDKVALEFKYTEKHTMLNFPGYAYKKIRSEISGADVIAYDPSKPLTWRIPFHEELVPSLEVQPPEKGYFIQPQDASMITPVLDTHGVKYSAWKEGPLEELEVFVVSRKELAANSFEGRQTLKVVGEWKKERVKLMPGTIFVPISQASPKLILHLFEPEAQDSLLSWGFFNRYYEQKEYMEDYVTHQVGVEMMKDPAVRKEFEERMRDPGFKKNPSARYEFFYRKHSSWDQRLDRYPVYKH